MTRSADPEPAARQAEALARATQEAAAAQAAREKFEAEPAQVAARRSAALAQIEKEKRDVKIARELDAAKAAAAVRVVEQNNPEVTAEQNALEKYLREHPALGFLGTRVWALNGAIAKILGLSDNSGVLIGAVMPNSPAAQAGLRQLDVIQAVNGQKITPNVWLPFKAGDEVPLSVWRDGQNETSVVKLGHAPTEGPAWQAWRAWRVSAASSQSQEALKQALRQKAKAELDEKEAERRVAQQQAEAEADAADLQEQAQKEATLPPHMSAATAVCAQDGVRTLLPAMAAESIPNDSAGAAYTNSL